MRYAYLGPTGTFTEAALLQVADPQVDEFVPMPGVPAVLEAVRTAEVDRGIVPIENSVEGGVSATLDALSSGQPLVVVGETVVDRKSTRLNSSHVAISYTVFCLKK